MRLFVIIDSDPGIRDFYCEPSITLKSFASAGNHKFDTSSIGKLKCVTEQVE
jgi:hypothetical protein